MTGPRRLGEAQLHRRDARPAPLIGEADLHEGPAEQVPGQQPTLLSKAMDGEGRVPMSQPAFDWPPQALRDPNTWFA